MDRARHPDLASRLFASPERALALMRAAWPAAVGPELARRTEVVALDRGILRVKVNDATWQRGLVRVRGDILARLRQVAGGAAPRALGFIEGPVAIEPAPETPQAPPTIVAASADLRAATAAITDPETRARFLLVAGRYLGRFGSSSGTPSAVTPAGATTGSSGAGEA